MPNWCSNDLYISGPQRAAAASHIGAFKSDPEFDFNTIIPYPQKYADLDQEYGLNPKAFREKYGPGARDGYNSGGYEWCVTNWGTKWNVGNGVSVRLSTRTIRIRFSTAWSPPVPIVRALHVLFPRTTLRLNYYERGGGFAGTVSFMSEPGPAVRAKLAADGHPWEPGIPCREGYSNMYRGYRGG